MILKIVNETGKQKWNQKDYHQCKSVYITHMVPKQ